ncbi:hypothetical protein ACFL54_09550, partial [Planctomycetota bacterium]
MKRSLVIALISLLVLCFSCLSGCFDSKKKVEKRPEKIERHTPPVFTSTERTFALGYNFDNSRFDQMQSVDLWYFYKGRWQYSKRLDTAEQSVEFSAPKDGVFGFILTEPDAATGAKVDPSSRTPDFFVRVDTVLPVVVVANPNGGEILKASTEYSVTWTVFDKNLRKQPIQLDWSDDGGQNWQLIANNVKNKGHYSW